MKVLLKLKKLLFTALNCVTCRTVLRKRRARRCLKHLDYAYKQLSNNDNEHSMAYEDKCHKLDAIVWLINYYTAISNGVFGVKTPKSELIRIHRLRSKEVGSREHVFAGVLFCWIENKRIDCY